jgi:hypothetical protein
MLTSFLECSQPVSVSSWNQPLERLHANPTLRRVHTGELQRNPCRETQNLALNSIFCSRTPQPLGGMPSYLHPAGAPYGGHHGKLLKVKWLLLTVRARGSSRSVASGPKSECPHGNTSLVAVHNLSPACIQSRVRPRAAGPTPVLGQSGLAARPNRSTLALRQANHWLHPLLPGLGFTRAWSCHRGTSSDTVQCIEGPAAAAYP